MTIDINERSTLVTLSPSSPHTSTLSRQISLATNRESHRTSLQSNIYGSFHSDGNDEVTLELVRRALQHCGYDQLRRIKSYCHHGRVVLQGRVATYYLKQVAQEVVLNIEGVRDVDNDLHVICSR